jgi:hypothetical protein
MGWKEIWNEAKLINAGYHNVYGTVQVNEDWEEEHCDTIPPGVLIAILMVLGDRIVEWFCEHMGHLDLVDDGYAGPDSGCISMSCRSCGKSWPTDYLY